MSAGLRCCCLYSFQSDSASAQQYARAESVEQWGHLLIYLRRHPGEKSPPWAAGSYRRHEYLGEVHGSKKQARVNF